MGPSVTMLMSEVPAHDRPRERLLRLGADVLAERELLAVVLRDGTVGAGALDLADRLLAEHGSIGALARLQPEELARCHGIGLAKASALAAAFALGRRSAVSEEPVARLRTAEDVARVAQSQLGGAKRERVLVLVCDGANRLRRTEVVSEGSIDRSLVPVREVLNAVLRHDGRAFALAHNHPSGDPTPSASDHSATLEVAAGAKAAGLRFLGHVVVADEGWNPVT